MTSSVVLELKALLGTDSVLTASDDVAPFLTDHRHLYQGRALAVALPRNVGQVSQLLNLCHQKRIGVVPHGGNTGYCGGATPDESGSQLVVSLRRLNDIRDVDAFNYSLTAEAGCVLADLQQEAASVERFFPLHLGSAGSCQLGGNLSTNAGGTNVLRYGMMRDLVLGLEVVLADGRVLSNLSALRKDNTGYDIKSLFLGAEGTLGIITAASVKLFPKIRATATAFAAVPDVQAAVTLLSELREGSGERVSSFELIPRLALELTTRHIPGVIDPLGEVFPWYVLCELSSSHSGDRLDTLLEGTLAEALERGGVLGGAVAQNERERANLWKLRESIPEAQRLDGANLKHDISVPVVELPRFVEQAAAWVQKHVPDGRLIAYGHVGDGNLHFNINQAPNTDRAAFMAREQPVRRAVHDMVRDFGGSFSAEHGIGRLKVEELERYAPPVELELMRAVKRTFDPHGIMNPGKVLRP